MIHCRHHHHYHHHLNHQKWVQISLIYDSGIILMNFNFNCKTLFQLRTRQGKLANSFNRRPHDAKLQFESGLKIQTIGRLHPKAIKWLLIISPVQFLVFSARALAPLSKRTLALSRCPRAMARWRGVLPLLSLCSTSL